MKTSILIVEDEAIVAADLAGKLRRLGYDVAGTTAQGEEAVALASRLRPNLVLMDIWLKGPLDGIEAAEAIRSQHDVPVIYLTAHSDAATLARAKLSGPFGYILKPFEERELATQIEMAIYRHQADRQLRQQRELLRVTLTSIGDAVIATDAAARITFVNPVAEALTGWKAEEAAGQPIQRVFRIVNERTGQPLEEPVARVLREGRAVELANHTALMTKDGRTVPIEDSAAPILDAAGQVIGAVLVFHDVTEKRRAEDTLRESEARLRVQRERMPIGYIVFDERYRFSELNPAAEVIFGYSQAELRGRQVNVIVPDAIRPQVDGLLRRLAEGDMTAHGVNENVTKDGRTIICQWTNTPLRDAKGDFLGFLSMVQDITERKRAEVAAQRSEALLRAVTDNTPDPIFLKDRGCRLLFANPATLRAIGKPAAEVIGKTDEEFYDNPEVGRAITANDRRIMESGQDQAVEEAVPSPDGTTRVFLSMKSPFRDAQGQIIGIVGVARDITERKRVEDALLKSEQEFRTLAEAMPQIVWATRPDGWNIYFNQQWVDYTGLTLDESYGHGWNIPFHPDDRQRAWDAWQRATQHDEPYLLECRLRRADGVYRWWLIHGTPMRGANGEIQKWFGTCTDIEERKQAEVALRESEERLRLLGDNLPDSAVYQYVHEADGSVRFLYFSAGVERLNGVSVADVLRDAGTLHRQSPPEYIERLVEAEARSHRDLSDFDMELPMRRPDGEVRWMRLYSRPRRSADGRTIWDGVQTDITERKRAEDALRERERLLQDVIDGSPSPIFLKDRDGRFIAVNASLERLLGIPREEIKGKTDYDIASKETADHWRAHDTKVMAAGKAIQVEEVADLQDGHHIFLANKFPLVDAAGQVYGVGAISHDITERKKAEEALQQAKEAAEAANVAKSQFLANMSHELRTPMNAILGMIDVALPKAIDPTVQDCLQTARGSADLLLTLLNDLLDSAKIESGKLELESAPFSLRRMLDQITRALSVRASEKGLCFYCRMPDETPDAVIGDRMRLQQILLNLAGNAIKFTEHGEVEMSLRSRSQDGEACLEFAVRDTGIGIPPSGRERLFQPFAQADASMARRFGGTGLGLAISKRLVEMMGGRIWVESELGKGSTFCFAVRLPLTKELPADFEAPAAYPALACAPLRILLVEDNPANQKLANYILQDRGHLVEIAGDGQEAVYLTEQNRYDVILMDVQMPGMNGLEATAAIRKRDDGDTRVPIIAMTAHAMKGDRDRCLAAGMNGYLSKPVNAQEMIGLVESLACVAAPRTQPAAATPTAAEISPQATSPVFDAEEALSRCFDSEDMVREMIQCFFDEVDTSFPKMRAALEKGDLEEVGRLGHRMKGTVVYLGAEPAKRAALRVERFCKSSGGTQAEAGEAVNALEHECIVLKAALSEHPLAAELKQGE